MDMYGQVANTYSQELQNGVRLQSALDMQGAQQPQQLFDRFMNAYQQEYLRRRQEQEMARKQQHEDTYLKMAQNAESRNTAEAQNKWRDDVYNAWDGSDEMKSILVDQGRTIGIDNPEKYFSGGHELEWNGAPMAEGSSLQKRERGGGGYLLKKKAAALAEQKLAEASARAERDAAARVEAQNRLFGQQEHMANVRHQQTLAILAAKGRGGDGGMSAGEYRQFQAERDLRTDQEKADEKRGKADATRNSINLNLDEIDRVVGELENHPGRKTGTGLKGIAWGKIPATKEYDFAKKLDTLKNQIALGALKELRASSKTGGGVGNVSDKDIDLLKNSIDTLEQGQSSEQFGQALKAVRNRIAAMRANNNAATGGDRFPNPPQSPGGGAETMKEGQISKSGKYVWRNGGWVKR